MLTRGQKIFRMTLQNSTEKNRGSFRSVNLKWIVVVLIGLILICLFYYGFAEYEEDTTKTAAIIQGPASAIDLVFVVDIDVEGPFTDRIRATSFMRQFTRQLTISQSDTRVGIITYRADAQDTPGSQGAELNCFNIYSLTSFTNYWEFEAAIGKLAIHRSSTNIQSAVRAARRTLREGGKPTVSKSVIILTDGIPARDLSGLIEEASYLKIEATVAVIGVQHNENMEQFEQVATNKDLAVGFSDFYDWQVTHELSAMIQTILTRINKLLAIPAPDVTPPTAPPPASSSAIDLVFVVDSSGLTTDSTRYDIHWPKVKEFMKQFTRQFTISQSETRVGFTAFNDESIDIHDPPGEGPDWVDFAYLTAFANAYEFEKAIDNFFGLPKKNLAAGLRTARKTILRGCNGDRWDVTNLVIVLTVRGINVDQQYVNLFEEATKLREEAIVATLTVTKNNVDKYVLEHIATNKNLVMTAPSFSALIGMEESLLAKINEALLTQELVVTPSSSPPPSN